LLGAVVSLSVLLPDFAIAVELRRLWLMLL